MPLGLLKEFREFALKGNMLDMAVGLVLGAAFGSVVNSMVEDVLTPPIGYLTGRIDLSEVVIPLPVVGGEPVEIRIGRFLNAIFSLVIVAASLFVVIKGMNRARRQFARSEAEEASAEQEIQVKPDDVRLLEEIRDLLAREVRGDAPPEGTPGAS